MATAKDASFSLAFTGTQASLYGVAAADGGYARITLANSRGDTVLAANMDMYSKVPTPTVKFVSPIVPKDRYTVRATVLGENWYWVNKAGAKSGSQGVAVSFDKALVRE